MPELASIAREMFGFILGFVSAFLILLFLLIIVHKIMDVMKR